MDKFKVKHVIISTDENAQPVLMSLHIPLDGKMRVHTIRPNMSLFAEILTKIKDNKPIEVSGLLVEIECPTYYALFPEDNCSNGRIPQMGQ